MITGCNERLIKSEMNDDQLAKVNAAEHLYGLEIIEVEKVDDKIHPTLINGKEVDRSKWLEVVRIGNKSCTGTIVGRNCVITAAHCGNNNSRSTLEVYGHGTIDYRVVHHPRYRSPNYDIAVLVLDQDVPSEVKPAIAGVSHAFSVGQDVDILGYGCIRIGGGGGNDGILRFGESKVTGFTGTDVTTSWRPHGGALCFGDSGGPMFADKSNDSHSDHNVLVAVNSKGNIRDTNYNMRLDYAGVREWLESVANSYSLEIYGVNAMPDDGGNQDPDVPPSDPTEPSEIKSIMARDYRSTADHFIALAEKLETSEQKPLDPQCDDPRTYGL